MGMVSNIFFVCYKHNCVATGVYLVKYLHYLIRSFCIKITSRLICKNDSRVVYQCSCYCYTLTLAAAQLIWLVMAPVTQIHHIHHMFCLFSAKFFTHACVYKW